MKKLILLAAVWAAALATYALPTYEPFTQYSNACVLTGTNAIDLATGGFVAPSGETWSSLNFSGTAGTGLHGLDIDVTNVASGSPFTATALSAILPASFPGFPTGAAINTYVINAEQPFSYPSANYVGNSAVLTFSQDITRPTNGVKTLFVSYLFVVAQKGQTGGGNDGRYLAFLESTNLVEGSNTVGAFKTWGQMFNAFNTISNNYFGHAVFAPSSTDDLEPVDSSKGLTATSTALPLTFNQPAFVVGEFVFTTNGTAILRDTNILWMNPSVSSFGGPTPPTGSSIVSLVTNTMSDVGGMVLIDRVGSGAAGGIGTNYIANLLIGSTWSYVTGGPEFTNQPVSFNAVIGGNATLSASAIAAAQSVTYRWQKIVGGSTNNLTDGAGTAGGSATVSGSGTGTLTLTGVSPGDLGVYQVTATASGTGFSLPSSTVLLFSDPVIVSSPQPAQANFGGQVTFTATIFTADPSLTYVWFNGSTPLANGTQSDGSIVTGATGTVSGGTNTLTLTVSNVSYLNNGALYSLYATNNVNNSAQTVPAALTVIDPYIVAQPTNEVVLAGATATIAVSANGSPSVGYQWFFDGNPLSDGAGPGTSTISGSQSNVLVIAGVNDANDGTYFVTVTGNSSSQTTNSATVTLVAADPVAIVQPPQSLAERVGDHLAFVVGATGGALNYQWQLNGTNLAGATASALGLTNIQPANAGTYTVVVSNINTTTSASATLAIINSTVLPLAATNIVVARVGDGAQALSGAAGNTIYLDQYTPAGVYVSTIQVPDEAPGKPYGTGGGTSLSNSPALLAQGGGADAINSVFLTLSANDRRYLGLAGYCQQYPFSAADVTAEPGASTAWRGLSTIDAFGNYTLAYTNFGLYSGGNHTIRSMTTLEGTNFYTTGQAGSGGVKFVNSTVAGYANGGGVPSSSASATGTRVVQVVNGPLTGYSSVNNLVCSDSGGLFVATGTPEPGLNGSITFNLLILEGGQPNDFAFSPDNQTVYIADGQEFSGTNSQAGGIERWDTNASSGGWTYSYTLPVLNGATNGAQGLEVSFPPAITSWGPGVVGAILYATSYDTRTNSLVQIVDNGPASAPTVIATAGPNQALRGVRFGPTAIPVSILAGPISQTNFPGNNATFAVTAGGTPPFFYQWQLAGTNIVGATKSSFTESNLTFASSGTYSVIVSNLVPSSTSTGAVLTVTAGAPTFTLGVPSYVETVGDHLAFAPSANGTQPINAQWFLNNLGNPIPNATNTSLVLTNIQLGQSGTYIVQVSNVFGTASSSGTLLVTPGPQTLSSNNLIVARIGDGVQPLSAVTGNTLYLDQYTPAGLYVNTIQVPDEGTGEPYGTGGDASTNMPFGSDALLVCGGNLNPLNDAPLQAFLTRSADSQTINFAGYCEAYPFAGPDLSVGANAGANWRGIGGVNAFGVYSLAYTNTGLYSGGNHQIHAAVSLDQTNYWTSGEAGTGGAIKYVTPAFEPANGGGIPAIGGSPAGTRVLQIVGGNIDFSDTGATPVGIYQLIGEPQNTSTPNILIPETNSPTDFAFSPDGQTVYIADNGAYGGPTAPAGGIQRWDFVSSTYTYSYTLATGGGSTAGARGVTVDFSAQTVWGAGVTGAKIYATTAEPTANRLIKITDTGAASTATTLITSTPGNILGGVKFGPQAVPVTIASQPQDALTLTDSGASFSVVVSGSKPYYYQWQFNGTNLAGATQSTLTVDAAQAAKPGTYTVVVSNQTPSTATSDPVSISFVPILTFNGNGQSWSANGTSGLPLYMYNGNSNVVEMTQSIANQGSSTFFDFPVYVGGFLATWTYQVISPAPTNADGLAFVVQNDPRGPSAIAAFGGAFGYGSANAISPSAALEFNLFPNASGPGVAFDTNGAIGPNVNPTPVVLDSGNPINVSVEYLNGRASLSLFDTVTSNTFTTNVSVNIPGVIGTNQAYVGFTGSDGAVFSTQTISNFVFTSLVALSAVNSNGTALTLSWPTGIGGYVLQHNSVIGNTNWVNSASPISIVNGSNQTTVPISGGSQYFRLVNP